MTLPLRSAGGFSGAPPSLGKSGRDCDDCRSQDHMDPVGQVVLGPLIQLNGLAVRKVVVVAPSELNATLDRDDEKRVLRCRTHDRFPGIARFRESLSIFP